MKASLRLLGDLAEIQTGLPVRSLVSREQGGGVLVFALMPSSLKSDAEISPTLNDLCPSIADFSPEQRHKVLPEDILVTAKSTAGSMRCALVADSWNGEQTPCFSSSLIRIQAKRGSGVTPRYLHAWLSSPEGKSALYDESQSATNQLNLTATSIASVRVPIPSLPDQRRIVEFLHHAETAHRYATDAANTRFQLAREIAFGSMQVSSHPRVLIHPPSADGSILATQTVDGEFQANSELWPDKKALLDELDRSSEARELARTLDRYSFEFSHMSRHQYATVLSEALRHLMEKFDRHQSDWVRALAAEARISLPIDLTDQLSLPNGEQSVSNLLSHLSVLPSEAEQQTHIQL